MTETVDTVETAQDEPRIGLWAQLREDKRANGTWARPGFHAVAVHRLGVWRKSLPRVLQPPVTLLYYMLNLIIRNVYGIEIASTTKVGRRLRIPHQSGIVIHYRAELGDDCVILQNVTIGATPGQHEVPKLGNRVYVAPGAVIMGNVTIGDDVHIGPNAVVMSNVPARAMAITAPARVLPVAKTQEPPQVKEGEDSARAANAAQGVSATSTTPAKPAAREQSSVQKGSGFSATSLLVTLLTHTQQLFLTQTEHLPEYARVLSMA